MRRRTETALAVIAICASLGFAMWPYARDAGVILAAQDDPAALADAQLTMQLRDDQLLLQRNIETALAENDSDLAESLLAIAVDKKITIPDELTTRVAAAVAEDNSAGQIAKRFATGLVTGEADDVASLSERILVEERRIYPRAVSVVLAGGWRIEGRRFVTQPGDMMLPGL